MASIVKFTPITGVGETYGPHAYILQLDDFKFLLDCGWDTQNPDNQKSIEEKLLKYASDVDAILLSHPDIRNVGSLPRLYNILNKIKKTAKGVSKPFPHIYASKPTKKLGHLAVYDYFLNEHNTREFKDFTLDDVDNAFENIHEVKNNRPVQLLSNSNENDNKNENLEAGQQMSIRSSGLGSLSITALQCGHMIGGTMWRIIKDDEQHILYAVTYNLKKERHLNGLPLASITGSHVLRPDLMITDCGVKIQDKIPGHKTYKNGVESATTNRQYRNEALLYKIHNKLKIGGNCLIPCDSAGRILEIAALLESIWRAPRSLMDKYHLVILSNVGSNVFKGCF